MEKNTEIFKRAHVLFTDTNVCIIRAFRVVSFVSCPLFNFPVSFTPSF